MGRRGERQRKRKTEREREPQTQRKPADCSAAKAQALFQTMGMLSPKTSHEGGGWGKGEGTHGAEKEQGTRHLQRSAPHWNKQRKTITRTHTSIIIGTSTPSVLDVTHAFLP